MKIYKIINSSLPGVQISWVVVALVTAQSVSPILTMLFSIFESKPVPVKIMELREP